MKKLGFLLVTASLALSVSACTPIGVGAAVGSTAGVAAAREGGIKSALEDTRIRAKINELWLSHDTEMFRKVNLTVDQGRVLLTGVVQKPEHRVDAVRLSWQPAGVRQVINEIKVDSSDGLKGWARDNWISGRLRAAILFDKEIQSVNYSIDTVQGIVYLMGIAQSQAELNKVTSHARSVPYVKQVVSYVKLAGMPMTQLPATPAQGGQVGQAGQYQPMQGEVMQGPIVQEQGVQAEPLSSSGAYGQPTPPQPAGRSQPIVDQGF
ncbi:MAG: BON domain-containing protein [Alphaproteobacteria bacterium]|nr:BON domain-containing protein [Alphaproteobacteria bacterium]